MGEKTIGILGGMGPLATVELFRRIVENTPAKTDQEHLRIIIYNNPKVPDRTAYLLGNGENPLPELIKSAKKLEECGVDFIVIPCNAAHFFIEEIRKSVKIPVLSMIETAAEEAAKLGLKRVGVLATTGTIVAGVYHRALKRRGMETITPTEVQQSRVMRGIYDGVKKGNLELGRELILQVAREMEKICDVIIAGCTEVSLVLSQKDLRVRFIDAMDTLARKAVKFAME